MLSAKEMISVCDELYFETFFFVGLY